jgi:hypothetical protein
MRKAGDVLIKGGSPGHTMLVVDVAEDGQGHQSLVPVGFDPWDGGKQLNMCSKPMSYETGEIEGAKLAKTPILIYLSRVQYL